MNSERRIEVHTTFTASTVLTQLEEICRTLNLPLVSHESELELSQALSDLEGHPFILFPVVLDAGESPKALRKKISLDHPTLCLDEDPGEPALPDVHFPKPPIQSPSLVVPISALSSDNFLVWYDAAYQFRERAIFAERQSFEIDQITYRISHDLRSPLRAVNGLTHMIRKTGMFEDHLKAAGLFDRIVHNVKKINAQIETVLEYSRLQKETLQPVCVDLIPMAQDSFSALPGGSEARLQVDPQLMVMADPQLLQKFVDFIFEGCVLLAAESGASLNLRLERVSDERNTLCRLTAIPVPECNPERLFELYYGPQDNPDYLKSPFAMAHRIVSLHRGKIDAEWFSGEERLCLTFGFSESC